MTVGGTVAWRSLLADAVRQLTEAGLPHPELDASRLVEAAAGVAGPELATVLDEPATRRCVAHLDRMLERRRTGEPLQYVIGAWSFRRLELFVDERVLIPRPETEQVVERALGELDRQPGGDRRLAVDLGTGSGAIALALASERSTLEVWATDVSEAALDVARANLAGVGRSATRVRLASGSWFDALPPSLLGRVDLVVSNPPYVGDDEALPPEVADWEPCSALRAGVTGTEAQRVILSEAGPWLAPSSSVVLEIAPHQTAELVDAARAAGFADVEVATDLAGRERILIARSHVRDG